VGAQRDRKRPQRLRTRGSQTASGSPHDDRDRRILSATEELIAELGYDRVRLNDVADRAGVSVGSLQHRFRTRARLLNAAVEQFASEDIIGVPELEATVEDPYLRLVALLRKASEVIFAGHSTSLRWLSLMASAAQNRDLRRVLAQGNQRWRDPFEKAFAEALASGRVRSHLGPAELTTMVVALIDGCLLQRNLDLERSEALEPLELILTALHGVIVLQGDPAATKSTFHPKGTS
jgi:AcrR family transcriptional regulator